VFHKVLYDVHVISIYMYQVTHTGYCTF